MNKNLDNTLKDILKDEILTVNSNVFRIMHYIANIDFCADYSIVKINCEKSLTINQIKKAVNVDNINDYSIVCFIPYKKMYNYVFTIDSDNNTVNTSDFHSKIFGAFNYHVNINTRYITDFYRKTDFNDIRKNCIYCYVVYQHKNFNQQPTNKTLDTKQRFKFGNTSNTIIQNSIHFSNYNNSYSHNYIKYADIDKSGYYIDKNKYTIALRKYKAEKSKQRIDSMNHDTFITSVNNNLEIAKTYIINNIDNVNRINDIILTSFNHANRLYQQFIELHNTKTFKSETHCNNYIADINRYIQRINDEINDLNR